MPGRPGARSPEYPATSARTDTGCPSTSTRSVTTGPPNSVAIRRPAERMPRPLAIARLDLHLLRPHRKMQRRPPRCAASAAAPDPGRRRKRCVADSQRSRPRPSPRRRLMAPRKPGDEMHRPDCDRSRPARPAGAPRPPPEPAPDRRGTAPPPGHASPSPSSRPVSAWMRFNSSRTSCRTLRSSAESGSSSKQQLRLDDERARQRHALLLAAGERRRAGDGQTPSCAQGAAPPSTRSAALGLRRRRASCRPKAMFSATVICGNSA